MSGIYILKTKDGYRVSHTNRYAELVGMDTDINYYVDGKIAGQIFTECFRYDTLEEAIEHAKVIALNYFETDDGICVVKYAEHLNYGELTNG